MSVASDRQVRVDLRANVTPYVAAMRAAARAAGDLERSLQSAARASQRITTVTQAQTAATQQQILAAQLSAAQYAAQTAQINAQTAALERRAARINAQRAQALSDAAASRAQEAATRAQTAAIEQQTAALALQRAQQQALNAAQAQQLATLTRIGAVAAIGGAVALAGVAVAAVAYARFEKQMSAVEAVTNATAEEMRELSDAAIQAGESTKFSASEAARAQEELAKVGVSVADITGGALAGALSLAAAGQLDLAESATIAAQSMKIFDLQGRDVTRIADSLANGANKSAADVHQLGEALRQGGLVASQTGLDLEDTVGALSALADNALIGSDAGTSLKTALQRLVPQSDEAAAAMRDIGLEAYDANGNFVGITEVAGQLERGLATLNEEQRATALTTIFGSDAVRAATVLYEEGERGLQGYIDAVSEQGAAARVAAVQMDNLVGDLEELKGALETAFIQQGSGTNSALRDTVTNLTDTVRAFNNLPPAAQAAITQFALTSGAVLLLGGGLTVLAAQGLRARAALQQLAATSPGLASGLTKAAKAGGILVAVMTALSALSAASSANEDILSAAEALDLLTSKQTNLAAFNDEIARINESVGSEGAGYKTFAEGLESIANPSLIQRLNDIGNELVTFGGAEGGPARDRFLTQVKSIDEGLAQLANSGNADLAAEQFELFAEDAQRAGVSTEELNRLFPQYNEYLATTAANSKLTADSTEVMAARVAGVALSSEDATEAIDALNATIQGLLNQAFSVEEATSAFEASIDSLTDSVNENGTSLDLSTAAGRANAESLRAMTTDAAGLIQAMAENGATADELAGKTSSLEQQIYDAARALGFSEDEASRYSSVLKTVPATIKSEFLTPGLNDAQRNVEQLLSQVNRLDGKQVVTTIKTVNVVTGQVSTSQVRKEASGGYIAGPGTATSDSIPAMLSNGEYVIKAAAVARYGKETFDRLNTMKFAQGGYVGAGGGSAVSVSASASFSAEDRALLEAVASRPIYLDGEPVYRNVTRRMEKEMSRWS